MPNYSHIPSKEILDTVPKNNIWFLVNKQHVERAKRQVENKIKGFIFSRGK